MKILNYAASAVVLAGIAMVGCSMSGTPSGASGNDATVSKNINIGNFTKIDAATGIKVVFTQGKSTGVAKVTTTTEGEKYLKVYVKNNELVCRYDNYSNFRSTNKLGPTTVTVQAPVLNEVDLSSAAYLKVNGNLSNTNELEIELSSASKMEVGDVTTIKLEADLSSAALLEIGNVNADRVEYDLSSASKIVSEKVEAMTLDIETSSSSNCDVSGFNGTKIIAEASSASNITVNGITAINVKTESTSGSVITLSGTCENLFKDISSSGKIRESNLRVSNLNSNKTQATKRNSQPQEP